MANKLPQMWIVALEVLDEKGLWQTAHTWYCGENIETVVRTGVHQGRGGEKISLTQTIESPPTLAEVISEANNEMDMWIEAGLSNDHIRISKTQLRGKGKDVNGENDEQGG